MAVFKCKMCGGELDVQEGQTIATCDYCGTKQTVPSDCSEELRTLYNRANVLRMKSEFDKAEQIYEKIITVDPKQAEAYWGALLCKYGIEYVEDPKTYKRIPTCHRVSYDAMEADEYYKLALDNADSVQRKIYEEEAKYIDDVQKEILAISSKEEAFDVFICYKETDENGKRTKDSVIANDIYYQLTQEGYRVFYAAITLEDKLGSAYEPVIFAALNSAKVMLVIGTKPEYFNAVWVKNEWSRYIKLIKSDHKKLLIPCYQDMDAYELPEEFAHLQAQDMGKVGFISNIVRGIKKVVGKEDGAKVSATSTSAAAPLLKRAYMFAEERDWKNANQYAEKVLDIEPENAEAYIVKLLCDLEISAVEDLKKQSKPFTDNANFKKAEKFADDKVSVVLKQCVEGSNDFIYNTAKEKIINGNKEEILSGKEQLELIPNWRDAQALIIKCNQAIENIKLVELEALLKIRKKLDFLKGKIVLKKDALFCVKEDGTVLATGSAEWAQIIRKVASWSNIISLAVGDKFIVGLRADGTVIATGNNKFKQCKVEGWTNITHIVANYYDTYGIQADGMVMATEGVEASGELKKWHDIEFLAVDDCSDLIVGVSSGGDVLVYGNDDLLREVAKWKNIVEVFTDKGNLVGLTQNGVVLIAHNKNSKFAYRDIVLKKVSKWQGIVSICGDRYHIMGLKQDGTVETDSIRETQEWKNILAISSYGVNCVGINDSGTLVFSDNVDAALKNEASHWKLFSSIDSVIESQKKMLQRLSEERERKRIIAENKHKATAEREKMISKQRKLLNEEKDLLKKELSSLGLFALKRKGEIKARLEQIEDELKKLV